jgi:hypothetical protein
MAQGVASISPLVAFCAVIPSARVVTILFQPTILPLAEKRWLDRTDLRKIKTVFFAERLSLMERIILGIWHGYL